MEIDIDSVKDKQKSLDEKFTHTVENNSSKLLAHPRCKNLLRSEVT